MMDRRVATLLEQAKRLPKEDQSILAEAMYELVNPPDPEWEAAWLKECQDRLAAYDRGEMKAHDFDEVIARLRGKYSNR